MTDKEIDAYKHRLHVKAWKARNRDKWLALKRAYYQRRKAFIIQKNIAWAKANPEKVKAIRETYKARLKARKATASHA